MGFAALHVLELVIASVCCHQQRQPTFSEAEMADAEKSLRVSAGYPKK